MFFQDTGINGLDADTLMQNFATTYQVDIKKFRKELYFSTAHRWMDNPTTIPLNMSPFRKKSMKNLKILFLLLFFKISFVGLTQNIDKYPFQLSGGEQQRVSIARAVVKKPKIMFCDEPTGALDEENAKEILGVIQKLNETFNTTVVLITHNPSIGVMADRIVKLNNGEVVEVIVNKNKKRASEIIWG